jgi:hypothetical protein
VLLEEAVGALQQCRRLRLAPRRVLHEQCGRQRSRRATQKRLDSGGPLYMGGPVSDQYAVACRQADVAPVRHCSVRASSVVSRATTALLYSEWEAETKEEAPTATKAKAIWRPISAPPSATSTASASASAAPGKP